MKGLKGGNFFYFFPFFIASLRIELYICSRYFIKRDISEETGLVVQLVRIPACHLG